jgi:hypothetical protein
MIQGILVKAAAGKAWEKIKAAPPWVWYLLALTLAALALDFYVDRQVAQERQRVTDHYEARIKQVNDANDAAIARNLQRNKEILDDIKGKVKEAQQVKIVKETIIRKVPQYVTRKADAACTIPAGFVLLHNETVSDRATAVPGSGPSNADAASGVALSTVAEVTGSNNAECVYRGKLLEQWADWYPRAKASYEQYRSEVMEATKAK